MENMSVALELMVVGMVTVFLILLIVIYFGKLLILVVNKWAPEEATTVKKKTAQPSAASNTIDATTMEVLQAAVKQLTGGKGHVAGVKKL
jgi:oxaloacetate decarboxylase gamma subunit